jgi:hypothetical protein
MNGARVDVFDQAEANDINQKRNQKGHPLAALGSIGKKHSEPFAH